MRMGDWKIFSWQARARGTGVPTWHSSSWRRCASVIVSCAEERERDTQTKLTHERGAFDRQRHSRGEPRPNTAESRGGGMVLRIAKRLSDQVAGALSDHLG